MASSSGNEAQSGGAWDRVGTSHTMATAQPGDELTHWLPTDAIQQAPLHRESIPVGRHYMLGLNLGISQAAKRGGFALRGRLPNGERLPRELATRIAQMVTKQAQREARMCGHRFRLCRRCSGLRCTICYVSNVHHQYCRCPKPTPPPEPTRRSARLALGAARGQ